MVKFKPWEVRIAGREVCLCHDHMEQTYFRAAHHRWHQVSFTGYSLRAALSHMVQSQSCTVTYVTIS